MLAKFRASSSQQERAFNSRAVNATSNTQGGDFPSNLPNYSLVMDHYHTQSDAGVQRVPTLKRKAGSPNLTARQFQTSPPPKKLTDSPDLNIEEKEPQPAHCVSYSRHIKHIHSIASDLDGYISRARNGSTELAGTRECLKDISNIHKSEALSTHVTPLPYHSSSQDSIDCESCSSRRELHALQRENGQSFPTTNLPSDASMPSISRFPLPPYASKYEQPPNGVPEATPKSPTIYHFRGASFEFVNPRSSLRLQDIETPAEPELVNPEYFSYLPRRKCYMATETEQAMESPLNKDSVNKSSNRPTPPRSLFDDLSSAYQSITSRNLPEYARTPSAKQQPFNPGAQANVITPLTATKARTPSSESLLPSEGEHIVRRPPPVASFSRKSSQGLVGSTSALRDDPSHLREKTYHAQSSSDDEIPQRYQRFKTPKNRRISTSHLSGYSTEFEHDDESTGDLIASYGYDRDLSKFVPLDSKLSRHASLPTRYRNPHWQSPNNQTESTIGDILDQYHRQDTASLGDESLFDPANIRSTSMPAFRPWTKFSVMEIDSPHRKGVNETLIDHIKLHELPSLPQDLRVATAKALKLPSKTAPCLPLPKPPVSDLLQPAACFDRNDVSRNSSSPSALSYGDTRNLLLLSRSQSSNETKQHPEQLSESEPEKPCSEIRVPRLKTTSGQSAATVKTPYGENTTTCRDSQQSLEDVLSRDMKYLRRISGLSDFQGSVYVIGGNGNSVKGQDESDRNDNAKLVTAHPMPKAAKRMSKPPVEATWVPVAAFQQNSVVPGIFRLPTAERDVFSKSSGTADIDPTHRRDSNPFGDEESTPIDDEDYAEWETLPESRATLQSQKVRTPESEDWSSYCSDELSQQSDTLSTNRLAISMKAKYKPSMAQSYTLEPSYEFNSAQASRQTTTKSMAPPLYNMYKHPVPLSKTLENPFTSSPPQIAGSSRGGTPAQFRTKSPAVNKTPTKENEDISLVSIGYQFHPVVQDTRKNLMNSSDLKCISKSHDAENRLPRTPLSHQNSSAWLSTEPGPEVSLEAEHGSPAELSRNKLKTKNTVLSSGIDPSLVHMLRKDDPRMVSSPLNPSNSFHKLSSLGPKANLTGTPNGTGMREVGSSLIGSSPLGMPESSPAAFQSSVSESLPAGSKLNAPLTYYPVSKPHFPQDNFKELHEQDQFGFCHDYGADQLKLGMSFKDAMMAENRTQHADQGDQRSEGDFIEMDTMASKLGQTPKRILLPPPVTYSSLPRLHRRYKSPSSRGSETRARKQKLSWILFAGCSVLPYMLILYGHGVFDVAMTYWTDGEIEHCARWQKMLAKIVGWGSAAATIFVVVILFIVVRTVPNNLPR